MANVLLIENISLAFHSILANKMRAFLTMLGIIIGISSVIAIETVGNSLSSSFSDMMSSVGASNIDVMLQQKETEEQISDEGFEFRGPMTERHPQKEDLVTDEMIEELLAEYPDELKGVQLSLSLGNGTVSINGDTPPVKVDGGNDDYMESRELEMVAGSSIGDKAQKGGQSVCLISDYIVEHYYHNNPDEVLGRTIEVTIGQKFYDFTVIGIYKYEANQIFAMADTEPTTSVYVPLKTVQDKSRTYGYSSFTVITDVGADVESTMDDINEFFDRYYHSNDYFMPATMSLSSMVSQYMDMLNKISLAISVIAGISLLVGGIGVMNIMLVSISERTREIGTRKALGATNGSIRVQFIVESMILCLIGGVIGIIIGVTGGSLAATKLMECDAAPSIGSIIVSVGFSLAIGVFFGFYPANKAAKMNPIDALRYE